VHDEKTHAGRLLSLDIWPRWPPRSMDTGAAGVLAAAPIAAALGDLYGPIDADDPAGDGGAQEDEEDEAQEDDDDAESESDDHVGLGAFGGFGGSMDGGSIAAPLSPPALRTLSVADGGVDPDKAGGQDRVTDEQRAAMLLLQDPVYRECATRLEKLRAVHHKGKDALSKAKAAGPAPSPSGALREDVQGQRLEAKRLQRLAQLESQLELALQNQRRYVLGRAGIAHLADGMVHLQGLGRLNESSAWVAPGGAGVLDSPYRGANLAATQESDASELTFGKSLAAESPRAPADLAAALAQPGIGHVSTLLEASPIVQPGVAAPGGEPAAPDGGLRLDFADVAEEPQPQPVAAAEEQAEEQAEKDENRADDSLSEHSPTASEIEAASLAAAGGGGGMADIVAQQEQLPFPPPGSEGETPDDGSGATGGGGGGMATAERDAMGAQLLDQLQRMEAQHLDSAEYSEVPRGATLILQEKQQQQKKEEEAEEKVLRERGAEHNAAPAAREDENQDDGEGAEEEEEEGRYRSNNKRRNRTRPLRRTRASALDERGGVP
jgi:hypothetical protein